MIPPTFSGAVQEISIDELVTFTMLTFAGRSGESGRVCRSLQFSAPLPDVVCAAMQNLYVVHGYKSVIFI